MMVATIAATATYKWLSSVGFTSADRMALAEAKESSHAGLDAVRSWMTYHANDVGAIIRQYYDGGKKPVALTNLVHGVASSKQQFSVWLTGVDASRDAYKITIVSTGTSRTDAKYSETSVLNVRGLYKVKEPIKLTHKTLDFGYSYFGGSTKSSESTRNTSMLINGNWKGNPPIVDEDFVVTGKAELSGNNLSLGNHTCIGGDFTAENSGVTGRNLYVHGNALNFGAVLSGSAYFEKNLELNQSQALGVDGDLTVNGKMKTAQGMGGNIKGNFCMGPQGQFVYIKQSHQFTSNKNIKFQNPNNAVDLEYNDKKSPQVTFGGAGSKLYAPEAKSCLVATSSVCTTLPPFYNKAKYVRFRHGANDASLVKTKASVVESPSSDMNCDESVKEYCSGLLGKEKKRAGCASSDFKIDDMLTTAYANFKKMNKTKCGNITPKQGTSFNMQTLNGCFNSATEAEMYNDYVVVKLNKDQTTTLFYNPTGTLNGNFIFFSDEYIPGEIKLPPTTSNSNVFIYLAKGAETINTTNEGGSRNYFIYSKENIKKLMFSGSGNKYTGSFYLTAESCASIEEIISGGLELEYNTSLTQHLLDHAVICDISEEGSCGTPVSSGEGGINTSGEDKVEGYDVYYVATAPQLSITLESQRRNREVVYDNLKPSEYTTVKPSIVVMPRVVYLNDKPEGKLQDYFTVVNLNGANETFNPSNTTCKPELNPTGLLRTGSEKLEPEIYECEYTAGKTAYGKNKFWVVVDGDVAGKSRVSFDKEYRRIFANSSELATVSLVVDANQPGPVTVTLKSTYIPSGWTVTKADIVSPLSSDVEDDGSRLYTVTVNAGTTTPLFFVKADEDAEKNMVSFSIENMSANGRIGNPHTSSVQMTGEGFINRVDFTQAFCNDHETIDDVKCEDILKRDDCVNDLASGSSGEWITADCQDRYVITSNASWQCSFAGSAGIKLVSTGNTSPLCDLFIYDSSLTNLVDGKTYGLFASYKAKSFQFTTVLKGTLHNSFVNAYIVKDAVNLQNFDKTLFTPVVCKDSCTFNVSAGYHVVLEPVEKGDVFSKWSVGGRDTSAALLHLIASSDTTVYARFNDSDDHCFYSDFKNTVIWCNQNESDCIDKCTSSGKKNSCSTTSGGMYSKSAWIVTKTNNGQNFSTPERDGQNFLYYQAKANSDNGNGTVTYLLSRSKAGSHGKMMARFKTCSVASNKQNEKLNSGFILRSAETAENFAIINILGVADAGSYKMVARVCEGDGTGIKGASQGNCSDMTEFKGMNVSAFEFTTTIFNADIDVRGDKADITLSYKKNGNWKQSRVSLDIGISAASNPSEHFVGAALADDCFKLGNIGWESYDFGENSCPEIPHLSCSFAANYLGGILPINESVTPWVATSKWFNDKDDAFKLRSGCSISYHYNGCDLRDGYSAGTCTQWIDGSTHCSGCNHMSDEGPYYVSGLSAETMRGEEYAFTYAGFHGVSKEYLYDGHSYDGAVRDASISVDCGDEGLYETSCGRFMVGKLTQCAQSVGFRVSECNGGSECVVTVVGGSANLRASSLVGDITGLPDVASDGKRPVVTMVLKDAGGHSSQQIQISGNGHFSSDVNFYSDMQDFDPEQVASIELSSNYGFSLSRLQSDCPNSIGVYNCTAEFTGDRIEVSTSIMNAQGGTCKVEGIGNEFSLGEKDCPTNGKFTIPAVKLQEAINTSNDAARDYTFKVTMTSKENKNLEETCVTSPMTVSGNSIRCGFGEGIIEKLKENDQLPSFNYSISNCPPSGCSVELRLNNGNPSTPIYNLGGLEAAYSPAGSVHTGVEYIYVVKYDGSECYASFTLDATGDKPIDNCSIDEATKTFTADLSVPTKTALTLVATDLNGIPMSSPLNSQSNGNKYSHKLPELTKPGDYLFVLKTGKGKEEASCSVPYTVEDSSNELPEDLGCYIDGEYVKTTVKNNTPYDLDIALNCGPVGEQYGNNIGERVKWRRGAIFDANAYVSTNAEKYWDCKEIHLWSDKFLCGAKIPNLKGDEPEGPVSCGIYNGDAKVSLGKKNSSYTFKVTGISDKWNGYGATIKGTGAQQSAKITNGTLTATITTSKDNSGSSTYTANVNGNDLCSVDFSWTNNGK